MEDPSALYSALEVAIQNHLQNLYQRRNDPDKGNRNSGNLNPHLPSVPSRSSRLYTGLFAGTEIPSTTVTATPRPNAVLTFFDTARNVHIPRKKASAMFSTNTARTKRLDIMFHILILLDLRRFQNFYEFPDNIPMIKNALWCCAGTVRSADTFAVLYCFQYRVTPKSLPEPISSTEEAHQQQGITPTQAVTDTVHAFKRRRFMAYASARPITIQLVMIRTDEHGKLFEIP